MKRVNLKMMIAFLAFVSITVACSYAMGSTPVEMMCGVSGGDMAVSAAAMAVATVAMPEVLKLDFERLTCVTQEQFLELQGKHGKLYVLDIEIDENERYQFIAKRPSKNLLSAIAGCKEDYDKANDMMIKNMIIAGDMNMIEDGVVFTHVTQSLASVMKEGRRFLYKA